MTPVSPQPTICHGSPRPLPEEEVRCQRRGGADDEARGAAERVAGDEHDVGRRLDIRDRGKRHPPEGGERGKRADERDDPCVGFRALIPGEAGGERDAEHA